MTDAAEYTAYHPGQIDEKLNRLIAILEAQLQTLPSPAQQAAPREAKLLPRTYPGVGLSAPSGLEVDPETSHKEFFVALHRASEDE